MGAFIVDRIVRAHLQDDGAAEHRLRPAHLRGRHPAAAVLGARVRDLKAQGAVFLQTEGKLAGCWVMRIEEERRKRRRTPTASDADDADDPEQREKVIVRSNGVVTYVGKDIANQFWKFGLLGLDFHYRLFATQAERRARCGRRRPARTSRARRRSAARTRIYNVIDSRQMYLQALLSQALRTLGHPDRSRELGPFLVRDGGAVARDGARARLRDRPPTTPRSRSSRCRGARGSASRSTTCSICSTNKAARRSRQAQPGAHGRGVPARRRADRGRRDPLLHAEVLARQADRVRHRRGAQLRGRNRPLPAVRRGPRRQHPAQAAGARRVVGGRRARRRSTTRRPTSSTAESDDPTHDLWAVVFEASRLDEVVEQVVRSLEFSGLAKYAFGLAQIFNAFYHRYPILNEENADRKRWRAAGVAYVRAQLTRALDLMGIDVPNRM